MKKKIVSTELMYALGMIVLPLGVALMAKADFGVSMVVAPAYILHLFLSKWLPFFSFGMAEYTLQAVLLVIMVAILRKFRWSYLFSFVTAVIYGFILDGWMLLVDLCPADVWALRAVYYVVGMLCSSFGVACFFKTYIAPEAYELLVKEVAGAFHIPLHRFKTGYDITSCLVSVAMSFIFFGFGHFEGVKLGTVVCALINGFIIGRISAWMDRKYDFADAFKYRALFEK